MVERNPTVLRARPQYRGQMSKYGATNPAEAYAEAYAQWHSGMHNEIADAYAARYGWTR